MTTKRFLALFTASPTNKGLLRYEVAKKTGYSRVSFNGNAMYWDADKGYLENKDTISFPEATATWGEITHFAIMDSGVLGKGHVLAFGRLTKPSLIKTTDRPVFIPGALDIKISGFYQS